MTLPQKLLGHKKAQKAKRDPADFCASLWLNHFPAKAQSATQWKAPLFLCVYFFAPLRETFYGSGLKPRESSLRCNV